MSFLCCVSPFQAHKPGTTPTVAALRAHVGGPMQARSTLQRHEKHATGPGKWEHEAVAVGDDDGEER